MSDDTTTTKKEPVKVWIVDGQLLTNRPDVFENQFELPETASVDGMSRVSQRIEDIKRRKPR